VSGWIAKWHAWLVSVVTFLSRCVVYIAIFWIVLGFAAVLDLLHRFFGLDVLRYIRCGVSFRWALSGSVAGTLRSGAGAVLSVLGGAVGCSVVLSLYVLLWSNVVICFNVPVSVSLSGRNGFPLSRCCSACRMSVVVLAMILAADAVGNLSFSGSQVSVSAVHSLFVSVIQVL